MIVPVRELEDDVLFALIGYANLYGGTLHPDGRLILGDETMWPVFRKQAAELGVRLRRPRRRDIE